MSGGGLLDADMRALMRGIEQAWAWWLEELRSLVPARFQSARRDNLPRLALDGDQLVPDIHGRGKIGHIPKQGARVSISIPRDLVLRRIIERPVMSERDLHRMLGFQGDTLLPFPAGTMIMAGRSVGVMAPGRMRIEVAGLRIDAARNIAAIAAAAGVRPARVAVHEDQPGSPPLDFQRAMRDAGIVSGSRSATPLLWALVGFLVALHIATMIWCDATSLARLEQVVQDQQPALSVAQTITRRAEQDRVLVAGSLRLRTEHDALGGLAAVSRILPDGAWLQRYVWDGATVRLTGYKPAKTDIATALRRSGRFSEVRSLSDETQATVTASEPFDLTARIVK